MTVQSSEPSIGARIRAIRKARGIRTTRELAELITGASMTESIIENIESGRKVNLDVSQLLNIAMALEVPPSFLLAPIAAPSSSLDLPGLSDAFSEMTALQFDAWLAGDTGTAYLPVSSNERYARLELDALRRLTEIESEILRLRAAIGGAEQVRDVVGVLDLVTSYRERIEQALSERTRIHAYLASSGWDLPSAEELSLAETETTASG